MVPQRFRAYRIHADGRFGSGRLERMDRAELDAGDVVVGIRFAGVNYKDALTAQGRARLARKFPLVGGTDLSGIVQSSADARFRPGDEVLIHSFGLGSHHDGGYAAFGRFPADWIFSLPPGLTLFEAAALGVAGHSVGIALELMERNGIAPGRGKVLVNGATGGVGSIAIDVLSKLGYHVVALTGKIGEADYLRSLGAEQVLDRASVRFGGRPLEAETWAGALDSVGGEQLEWLARTMQRDGVIAAIGNAGGSTFEGNVLPFILRGIRLLGVNVNNPVETKLRVWRRLASDLKPRHLDRIARRIALDALPQAFDDLLAARVRGRQVVDFGIG
ncbi:MAG TPA: acryloyl-CoA reductase [Burkholderiales bacterium]|nr:acryloyl-CoA reductase [Burkholderiales bacterium]